VRIVCVGGGPAGLYFSLLAKQHDHSHDITVFERSKTGSNFGWGVTIDPGFLGKLYSNDPESAGQVEQAACRWRKQYIHINGEQVTYDGDGDLYNFNRPDLVDILGARAQRLGVRIE
jgi:flavin-dependent dehydrogenase